VKTLSNILSGISIAQSIGTLDTEIVAINFDSRKVVANSVFVAVRGTQNDGHQFIEKAVALGAVAVVCEELPERCNENVTYIKVAQSGEALGIMASNFYDCPSTKLKLVGVTGTNGKTTTATLLYRLHRELGYKAGLFSTVRNYINDRAIDATHTTPDPLVLNKLLAEMLAAGCDYCFMEVSSHSVVQQRIAGLQFAGGIFTNLTHDHLDYHKTFDEYLRAKKLFFDNLPSGAFALTNNDDRNGMVMLQNTKAQKFTYSLKSFSDYKCRILENGFEGMLLNINNREVWTHFIGNFNAYNLLAVYAAALQLGHAKDEVLQIISGLHPVEGRFETIRSTNGVTAIVDYAHTPDALENVLNTIRQIVLSNAQCGFDTFNEIEGEAETHKKPEYAVNCQIITVVGAGGDRDKTKRPVMARIAAQLSDKVILTSDNPRTERPEDILHDMQAGVPKEHNRKVLTISDRREAIKTAVMFAQKDDIILIAGKGHETYQEINGIRTHFDDREVVWEFFEGNK